MQKRRCHTNGFLHIILDYVNPLSRAGLPAYKTSYLPDPKNVLSIELSLRSIINLAQSPSRHSEYKNMLKLFFRTFLMKKAKPNIFFLRLFSCQLYTLQYVYSYIGLGDTKVSQATSESKNLMSCNVVLAKECTVTAQLTIFKLGCCFFKASGGSQSPSEKLLMIRL